MSKYTEILENNKNKLLSLDNDITVASIAEENKIDKSVLYRHLKDVFNEEEILQIKKISRQKAVKKYQITWQKKYGIDNPSKLQSSKDKQRQTFLRNYGVDNPMKNKDIVKKAKEKCIQKYGKDNYSKTQEFKNLFKDEDFLKNKRQKEYITKKNNHSFNVSKQEDKAYELLKEKYPNIKRSYHSEKYPFNCDFYIPELDLYIEYQGHWSHGRKPFDILDQECLDQLNIWLKKAQESKYYKIAINVWVKADVKKRKIAKENNINYLELWNLEEVINWIKNN